MSDVVFSLGDKPNRSRPQGLREKGNFAFVRRQSRNPKLKRRRLSTATAWSICESESKTKWNVRTTTVTMTEALQTTKTTSKTTFPQAQPLFRNHATCCRQAQSKPFFSGAPPSMTELASSSPVLGMQWAGPGSTEAAVSLLAAAGVSVPVSPMTPPQPQPSGPGTGKKDKKKKKKVKL